MNVIAFVDHEIGYRLLEKMLGVGYQRRLVIRAVVTSPDNGLKWWPGVAGIAHRNALPLLRDPVDRELLGRFGEIDYFLLLSWKNLLPPELLAIPRRGTINLHYSLLPRYRGVYPVNWAIMRGEHETGVTYHQVGRLTDAGPIVCQAHLPIRPEDTARSLQLRLDDLAYNLFDEMSRQLLEPGPWPEPEPMLSGTSYFSRRHFESTNEIDLQQTYRAGELIDLLRGKTFLPHGRNAYFIDRATGRKIYVSLALEPGT